MNQHILDTALAKRLVTTSAIEGASIIGQTGGWHILLRFGATEHPLCAQRTDQPRVWRSLDRCVEYLKSELQITRIDLLDASAHSELADNLKTRADTSERMRRAHEAAAYDKWVREQTQVALDDTAPALSNDKVKQQFADKRAALRQRMAGSKA
ncbi:hypothetical protein [Undibacterium sp. TJN19]|uniref:hypothetical protein n=1 Tax=Undibacterium sp. TJN19 TaxID=3413055 RepID=UPI003BF40EA4